MDDSSNPQQTPPPHRHPAVVDVADIRSVLEPHGLMIYPVIASPEVTTRGISGGIVEVPPGGAARAHHHRDTDVIVIVTHGHALTLWGEELEHEIYQGPGQFLHIPAPVPHAVVNLSVQEPINAYEFRSDAEFSRDIHLLPHLQSKVQARADVISHAAAIR